MSDELPPAETAKWWHVVIFLAGVGAMAWAGGWIFARFSWDPRLGYGFGVLATFTVLGLAREVTLAIWLILLAICAPAGLGHRFGGNVGAALGALGGVLFLVACGRTQGAEGDPPAPGSEVAIEVVDVAIEATAGAIEAIAD